MKQRNATIASLLRHPLLLAIPLYVVLLSFDQTAGLRLWLLEPVAFASGNAEDDADLDDDEKLARENHNLQEQAASLAAENEFLRQALSQLGAYNTTFGDKAAKPIPARIILRGDSSNSRHSIYINRGSSDGVREGYPVSIGRTLIGRVRACSANVSLFVLITDPASVVPVSIIPATPQKEVKLDGNERASRGLLRGNSSATPVLPRLDVEDVDLASGITAGMFVVTNDGAGQFPAGLLVGTVTEVKSRQAFLEVEVRAAADVTLTDIVLVIPHQRPELDEMARLLAPKQHLDKVHGINGKKG